VGDEEDVDRARDDNAVDRAPDEIETDDSTGLENVQSASESGASCFQRKSWCCSKTLADIDEDVPPLTDPDETDLETGVSYCRKKRGVSSWCCSSGPYEHPVVHDSQQIVGDEEDVDRARDDNAVDRAPDEIETDDSTGLENVQSASESGASCFQRKSWCCSKKLGKDKGSIPLQPLVSNRETLKSNVEGTVEFPSDTLESTMDEGMHGGGHFQGVT